MATTGQVILTNFYALVIAIGTAWQWRSEGSGWLATIAAGIVAYVFWKIAISVAVGVYERTFGRNH